MEYRSFGQTDITVSALGFGCWDATVGQTAGAEGYGAEMATAVQCAVNMGITCFDTAPVYGSGKS